MGSTSTPPDKYGWTRQLWVGLPPGVGTRGFFPNYVRHNDLSFERTTRIHRLKAACRSTPGSHRYLPRRSNLVHLGFRCLLASREKDFFFPDASHECTGYNRRSTKPSVIKSLITSNNNDFRSVRSRGRKNHQNCSVLSAWCLLQLRPIVVSYKWSRFFLLLLLNFVQLS